MLFDFIIMFELLSNKEILISFILNNFVREIS